MLSTKCHETTISSLLIEHFIIHSARDASISLLSRYWCDNIMSGDRGWMPMAHSFHLSFLKVHHAITVIPVTLFEEVEIVLTARDHRTLVLWNSTAEHLIYNPPLFCSWLESVSTFPFIAEYGRLSHRTHVDAKS